jgi:hypothetical protein
LRRRLGPDGFHYMLQVNAGGDPSDDIDDLAEHEPEDQM